MHVDMTKTYKTRDGRPVRLLCTDNSGPYSIVGLVGGVPKTWTSEGAFDNEVGPTGLDLVEVSPYADWPIDAPIWVRDDDGAYWRPRHFAGVDDNGDPMAWGSGCTSFSNKLGDDPITWNQARLSSEFAPE